MTLYKAINGKKVKFEITYLPKYKADKAETYFLKIIDVSVKSGGFGPSPDWTDALEFARELTQ